MLSAVDRYAPGPGKKCAIDTLFDVLKAAGSVPYKSVKMQLKSGIHFDKYNRTTVYE